MLILTCKLGNEIINCYDGTHDKEQLKKWASKKILLCPVCGKPYEYCHGKVKTPYFRHMDKTECEDKYSESETEEHLNGKRDLFEWIKKQKGVTNAVLEGWIPKTKQRPDIMFEYNGRKYVIEYQCTPIASEYYDRHDLYKSSGIIDIWILGTEKYLKNNMRKKFLQDVSFAFYSYEDKRMIPINCNHLFSKTTLCKEKYSNSTELFYGLPLNNFMFDCEIFNVHFGKIEDVKKKIEYREELRERASSIGKRNKNKYLNMQNRKIRSGLEDNLAQLCNENWEFYIMKTYSKYKMFEYILAEPRVAYNMCSYCFTRDFKYKKYMRININKLDYDSYKKCGRDINYLKQLLVSMMIENKKQLLKYKDENMRFLEVNN